jgi:hypothetical protein
MAGRYLFADEANTAMREINAQIAAQKNPPQTPEQKAREREFWEKLRREERARREESYWYLHNDSSAGPWPGLKEDA